MPHLSKMKILVSCLDLRALVSARYIKEASRTSQLFALLQKETFDRLVLLALPETASEIHLVQEAIQDAYPSMAIDYLNLPIHSTDSYQESLVKLEEAAKPINLTFEDADLTVLISSGTEGTKVSWLLLAASGQISARMVQIQMPCVASNQLEPQIRTLELPRIEGAAQRFLTQYQALEHSPNFLEDMMDRLGICGRDSEWLEMINKAYCLAQSDASVLIQGEPGTGKELIARLMHACSPRAKATMVTLDCATLQEPLTESLLFGHVRGAFRGAYNDYKGKFQQAHGGRGCARSSQHAPV